MDINPYLSAVRELRALVEHDMAADYREGVEHCLELQRAIEALQRIDGIRPASSDDERAARTWAAAQEWQLDGSAPSKPVQGMSREGNVKPKMFHGEDPQDADS